MKGSNKSNKAKKLAIHNLSIQRNMFTKIVSKQGFQSNWKCVVINELFYKQLFNLNRFEAYL